MELLSCVSDVVLLLDRFGQRTCFLKQSRHVKPEHESLVVVGDVGIHGQADAYGNRVHERIGTEHEFFRPRVSYAALDEAYVAESPDTGVDVREPLHDVFPIHDGGREDS